MNSEQQPQTQTTAVAPVTQSIMKDLLIPFSIIIAGASIGLGLYFSSTTNSPTAVTDLTGTGAGQPAQFDLLAILDEIGLDRDEMLACAQAGTFDSDVQADMDNAVETGGRGTPWTIIRGPGGKTYPVNGALPAAAVAIVIQTALDEADQGPQGVATDSAAPVTAADNMKGGDENAQVKIIEYSDVDCPFCTRFHDSLNELMPNYEDNQVVWVYRHFPLEQLHPNARGIANLAECVADAGGNDAFWQFIDAYFAK